PKLVHLEFLKFSRGGPYENYLATELQLAALGGWIVQVGDPARSPLVTNSASMSAFVPGIVGALSALAALNGARRTGHGTHLDLSSHEALLFTTRFNETYLSYTGVDIKRAGNTFADLPAYRVFKTTDGYLSSAAGTDVQVETLMKMAGIASDLFATRDLRKKHIGEFCATLDQWFAVTKRDDVFHEGQRRRIPLGKVAAIDEVVNSEQGRARGFFEEIDHPVVGRRVYPGGPAKFSETPVVPRRAPLLGEHTAAVLAGELGFSREDLAALAGLGVI
ncbi:MAG: CoA transferase, partial [Candidatus Binataceae bacterium]